MTEQPAFENNTIKKNYKTFYFKMFIFLALIFVRNVFGAPISATLLLMVAAGMLAISDRNEIIYFAVCCLPLSPAMQHKYVILCAMVIYWLKYPKDIKINGNIVPLILMMIWEVFHAFTDGYLFTFNEYLRNFAEMIFCTFLMLITNKKLNYEILYRTFAVCTLVMMTIVLLNLLDETNYNFEKIFTGSYRFGRQEIEDRSFGVSYNQNVLGFICNLTISGLFQLIIQKKQKIIDYLFIGALMFFGFLTMSRSFIICCVFVFILFVFARGIKITSVFKGLVAATVIILMMYFIMSELAPFILEKISDRFNESDVSGGRLDLWSFYWNHLISKAEHLLFGIGLQNVQFKIYSLYDFLQVPHNGIQELLVVWGIPGMVFFVMYVYSIIKRARTVVKKLRLANYIPLLLTILYVQSGQLVRSGIVMLAFTFIYVSLCMSFEEKNNENIKKID